MDNDTLQKSFPAGSQPSLNVTNISGQVTILADQTADIHVKATKRGNGDHARTIMRMEQDQNGCVQVKVEFDNAWLSWLSLSNPCQVDLEIRVPPTCTVDVSTVSADIDCRGLQGALHFNSVSGEMDLAELQGDLVLSSVSGDMDARALSGNLRLNTVSGDVDLMRCDLQNFKASTVSGNIELESPLYAQGKYSLNSVSGSVFWLAQTGYACKISSSSISGAVHVHTADTGELHTKKTGRSIVIGENGPQVTFSSVSGDFTLTASLAAPVAN